MNGAIPNLKFTTLATSRGQFTTSSNFLSTLSARSSTHSLSLHAQKENINLLDSLKHLDLRNSERTQRDEGITEISKILQKNKQELLSMSNQLSKIVAKNDGIYHINKTDPSHVEIEYGSSRFFKIPCKTLEFPLHISVTNSYDRDYIIYYSKTCDKPDEENYNGRFYHPLRFKIPKRPKEYVYLGIYR